MIKIDNKWECCGCGACANICPKNCINMFPDEEGFLYPQVNSSLCINCGACDKVCAFQAYNPQNGISCAYAVQAKSHELLKKAASGGCYSVIAKKIVENGGLCVGASFDGGEIVHTIVDNVEKIQKHCSSKYVQSNTKDVYKEIKRILCKNPNETIVFSGTPCQIVALKKYLKTEYQNLYTVDLVCQGVSSPKVFSLYLDEIQKKHNASVKDINFRNKTYGYHSHAMKILFDDNKEYNKSRLTDPMMKVFNAHISDRPSCEKCVVKGEKRYSDLTIFDCWHYEELTGNHDNDLGHTSVLVHTAKGENLLTMCQDKLIIDNIDIQKAIELDGNMVYGRQEQNEKRSLFYEILNKDGLDEAIKCVIPITCNNRVGEFAKPVLYKLGLLDIVKRRRQK